jgi:hypothetical protein
MHTKISFQIPFHTKISIIIFSRQKISIENFPSLFFIPKIFHRYFSSEKFSIVIFHLKNFPSLFFIRKIFHRFHVYREEEGQWREKSILYDMHDIQYTILISAAS